MESRSGTGEREKSSVGQDQASAAGAGSAPRITLPRGGGAIRGIGEKFAAIPVTGTGSLSVPIAVSPGRSGFGPQLSLSYDSGAGNGPFGFGWNLSLPSITRKTDKGLPRYLDGQDQKPDSDVFILSGAEDLVPEYEKDGNGNWVLIDGKHVIHDKQRTVNGVTYNVHRYRPRIEGLFARIERWTNRSDPADIFWRSISKDNITTWYGKTGNSRIADPFDPSRVFTWLISESYDDKGNAIAYEYKEEDSVNVDPAQTHERNRSNDTRRNNRYLKRIGYGNHGPYLPELNETHPWPTPPGDGQWFFEVVLDYGEHDSAEPQPSDDPEASNSIPWPARNDPFSSYRPGFEVRTYRLCQRVLMFHHIPGLPAGEIGYDGLVRSTDFTYSCEQNPADARNPIYSKLLSVSQTGYTRNPAGGYSKKSMPPLEFEYSLPIVHDTVQDVDPGSLENLPVGLDGSTYQWTDLHGEGIPGILTEQAGAWFYKRNMSPIGKQPVEFAAMEQVSVNPNLVLAAGAQFMDLAGDGLPDLVVMDGPVPGMYEHDADEGWQTFHSFASRLNLDMRDPNLKFVDLDGDGHADVLITEEEAFAWHPSLAEEGFGPANRVAQALDEEKGPRVVFADGTQSIYLADLSGDGLTDIARVRNGEVCYWPNLGYGTFGTKVTMDNAPWFDNPDQFDQKRIRLADIDGSGTTDIIYLSADGVKLYFNQSGNSWSAPQPLKAFPQINEISAIAPVDLKGNGTACLVWSCPLPGEAGRQMRYVDLMGEQKPHLLIKTVNNLGAETRVRYAPSTKFFLQDKRDSRPWITRLPFPVHVVERVETYDRISRNRFVTRYEYHHGYFDGEEREFRGFGMVEQWDTEEFQSLAPAAGEDQGEGASSIDIGFTVPPVHTKTWFHTGACLSRERISRQFDGEYYREPGLSDREFRELLLPDTILPPGLTREEEQEACRALKGMMLRREIYADDAPPGSSEEMIRRAGTPYTVVEQNFTVRSLQPRAGNRHAVFFTHAREAVTYNYERNPADPRVSHAMTLEVDGYGTVLKSAAIGYGRREMITTVEADGHVGYIPNPELNKLNAEDQKKQVRRLITYTENDVTVDDPDHDDDNYRTPLPCEVRTYELTGLTPENDAPRFSLHELTKNGFDAILSLAEAPYEQPADYSAGRKRLVGRVRTLYRRNDLTNLLPLRRLDSRALPGETYKLAFTPGLIDQVYRRDGQPLMPVPGDVLSGTAGDNGGYVDLDGDGHWWIPSGRVFYSRQGVVAELAEAEAHFFLPRRFEDPFGNCAFADHDPYDLLIAGTEDALQNRVIAKNDYRVFQPGLITDPNGNRSAVAFDELGLVTATALMGKEYETDPEKMGDTLDDPTTRLEYDLFNWVNAKQPNYVRALARENHRDSATRWQETYSYSDGFGREIQKKIQAEPGKVEVEDEAGNISIVDTTPEIRWVGSGWTIFNNKGKPVRQYEPFFSTHHRFQFGKKVGVSPILFYDPAGRVVATLHANHTYEKVIFDPWRQATYDENDTVLGDPRTDEDIRSFTAGYFAGLPASPPEPPWQTWHQQRIGGNKGVPEQLSAEKASAHADTPTTVHFDALGRPFCTETHNKVVCPDHAMDGTEDRFVTRIELDIEGNQREVIDAKGRVVMRYDYYPMGPGKTEHGGAPNRIHQSSMEAGERWIVADVAGKPIRAWDSRGFIRRMTYDELRRPTGLYVTENGTERLAEQTIYGEALGDGDNHRTRIYQVRDGAGIVTNVAYDFKGNLRESRRELLTDYKAGVDWEQNPEADDGSYTSRTAYDALNRPVTVTSPDNSVYRPTFNEANLLDKVQVNLRGATEATLFVANINYNAKGQRELIAYGNGTETSYEYDPQTFRLTRLTTTRPIGLNGFASQIFMDPSVVQDLRYIYDPAENITRVEDAALSTVFYNGQQVDPVCNYTYDAIYRLIEAQGREHIGQTAFAFAPQNDNYRDHPFTGITANPNDLQAFRNYIERYEYDAVGNFEALRHIANGSSWTRAYDYQEDSLLDPGKKSNRLTRTIVGNGIDRIEPYAYDAHGNMTAMPHLAAMVWDFEDQLRQVDLGGGGIAYYVYDASGQRVRKMIESQDGTRQKERISLGAYEIYRTYNGNASASLERETLHIMDDKQRIALIETQTIGNNDPVNIPTPLLRYQHGNHLGSASVELDKDGELISYEEYHPYGTTAFQTGRSAAEVSLKRYRYTGKERDEESGLYYHGARYYASWMGRWCSADPAGLVDGVNVYAFVRGNPVRLMDYDGMAAEEPEKKSSVIEAVKGVFNVYCGVKEALGEAALGFVRGGVNPTSVAVDIAWEPVKNFITTVQRDVQGKSIADKIITIQAAAGQAELEIINKVNPVARAVDSAADTLEAAEAGDIRATAKHATHVAIALVETALIAYGGARSVYSRTAAGKLDLLEEKLHKYAKEENAPGKFVLERDPLNIRELQEEFGGAKHNVDTGVSTFTPEAVEHGTVRSPRATVAHEGGHYQQGPVKAGKIIEGDPIKTNKNLVEHFQYEGEASHRGASRSTTPEVYDELMVDYINQIGGMMEYTANLINSILLK